MIVAAPDLVVVSSKVEDAPLEGRLLPLLAPFLDGTRSVGAIARAVNQHQRDASRADRVDVVDVRFGLALLNDGGWLDPDRRSGSSPPASRIGRDGRDASARWPTVGGVEIVATRDYRHPDLAAIDRQARAAHRWWMPVMQGPLIWIGPIGGHRASPCWRCVTTRLDLSRPLRAVFGGSPSYGVADRRTVISDVALALVRSMLVDADDPDDQHGRTGAVRSRLRRHIVTVDPHTLTSAWHEVVPDPLCPCQGRAARPRAARAAIRLRHEYKTPLADGGYRTVSAEETFRRYERHVSPITGVVRRVAPYYADPSGLIHVYSAEHAFVVDATDRAATLRGYRRTATGKGMTAAQARTSALCEALERHSGVFRGSESGRRATFAALGDRAVHPQACLGFSDRQYEARATINRGGRPETWVPERFREDAVITWTEAWSLTHERWRFVPSAYCYYGYPRDPRHDFCRADSNGTAAGNTAAEAILQGFFELVERDAVALWWYHRLPRPGIDDSALTPYVRASIVRYEALGRGLDFIDLTTDFGVPVVAAISRNRRTGRQCIFGFGSHFDAGIAIARAVTEVNQFLPGALARRTQDRFKTLADQSFLHPSPTAPRVDARRGSPGSGVGPALTRDLTDLADDVRRAVGAVRDRGLEMLVVDQTRPDIGLPVVKVIVPGMRPFWPRLAAGRLYDVPVTLGWLPQAPAEEELNPLPFFI